MKSRPNNIVKQVARTKSPPFPSTAQLPHASLKPQPDIASVFQPEINRAASGDYKMRLSSPDFPRYLKRGQKAALPAKEEKGEKRETGAKRGRMEANGKKDEDDNTTEQSSSQHISYVTGEYQLDCHNLLSQRKNVKFEEKTHQLQRLQKKRASGASSARNSSILKNGSRVLDPSLNSSEKSISIQNSFTAVKKNKIGLSLPQDNINNITRKKYDAIVENLKGKGKGFEGREKYIDQLFPPVQASIFTSSVHRKGNISKGKDQIVWMRLSQIFPANTKVYSKNTFNDFVVTRGEKGYAEQYLISSFNAIKSNSELLEFIFQKEESNNFGIYLVKIYQECAWKYVIIDDLIPCIRKRSKKENHYAPLFVNANSNSGQGTFLWPYLLEKAYANYYSCYENLAWGNAVDFVSQITGVPYKQVNLINKTQGKEDLQKKLSVLGNFFISGNPIALGWHQKKNQHCPITLQNETFTGENMLLGVYDPQKNQTIQIQLSKLPTTITSVWFYSFGEYPNTATCPVYPPKYVKEMPQKVKQKEEKVKSLQIPQNETTSLRTFNLFKKTKCCINLKQKQIRFYSQCGITEYLWVRCLFLQKEYDGNFRWISGRYSNQKHIIFEQNLDPGEYYLIIMVEWRQRYNKELAVVLYSDCEFLKFQRKNYNREERILQLACMDLAQRNGKLNQINKSICSYSYLCQDSALIIENIVNQRTRGDVTIMRSITGLKSKVQILPLNVEFEVEEPEEYGALDKGGKKVISPSVEIDIAKGASFTVVLRMRGGMDRKFFKVFNFG